MKNLRMRIRQNYKFLKRMRCKYCTALKCDKRCAAILIQTKLMELERDNETK